MLSLWWARRDLRLHDNPALLEAQSIGPTAAVFGWSPSIDAWSGRRRAHLARVLHSLSEATDESLTVRRGAVLDTVLAAAREADARLVWAHREYSPSGVREQEAVEQALHADGRELRLIGSPYAVAPGRVVKADGTGYRVFTPFRDAWRSHGWRAPAPRADPRAFRALGGDADLEHLAAEGDRDDPLDAPHEHREDHILAMLSEFADEALEHYVDERDRPDLDTTSRLSVALAFGQLHPRTVLSTTAGVRHESARVFESQIAWREFHADTLWHQPRALRESLTPVLAEHDWSTGPDADAAFDAWRSGRTGYPLVDAGMRQLAATGWMHNRVRMVVASFLIKDLHVPWQRGAAHFRQALLDYDHAQNQLNWQWVAGTGRDAAPFFRIFNPDRQQAKFDPEGRYVRRWVPEAGTSEYEPPIVDHGEAREATLAAYRRAREAPKSESGSRDTD